VRDGIKELELLVRSGHGLIHMDTAEEDRALLLLQHVASRLQIPIFTWNRARGLSRIDLQDFVYKTEEPYQAFRHVEGAKIGAMYHFADLGSHFGSHSALHAQMKAAVEDMGPRTGCIVVTGTGIEFPSEVKHLVTTFRLPGPSEQEYRDLITQIVRDVSERQHVLVHTSPEEMTLLLRHLKGLTLMEADKILTKAIIEDGCLSADDIQHVIDHKRRVIERDGLLEYYPVEQTMDDIADLKGLKAWLAKRTAVVQKPEKAEQFGLSFPRGVLLTGVPGCGKSLSAKAVAAEWRMPLLKLDPSNLYNKYIGQSEQNFKRAMAAAEKMAPVVLWIDELEKAFASGGEDGGVSRPRTTSASCRPSSCGRGASTRSSSWTCPGRRRGRRSFGFIWSRGIRIRAGMRCPSSRRSPTGFRGRRLKRWWWRRCIRRSATTGRWMVQSCGRRSGGRSR